MANVVSAPNTSKRCLLQISRGSHIPLLRLHQQIFEIKKCLFGRVHVDERGRDTGLATTTCTTDLMHVVLNLLGHRVVDNVLNLVKVQALQ